MSGGTELQAVLFDLDGTLTDTDSAHFECWKDLLSVDTDIDVTREWYDANISGGHNALLFKKIYGGELSDEEIAKRSDEKEARFRKIAEETGILQPLPGLISLLDDIVAQVSSREYSSEEFMLEQIGARGYFETLVLGDECSIAKPHPEPYLEACKQLGVDPRNCIVFEDSPSGVTAAAAAGVGLVVGVTTSHTQETLCGVGAHECQADFSGDSVESLASRLAARLSSSSAGATGTE